MTCVPGGRLRPHRYCRRVQWTRLVATKERGVCLGGRATCTLYGDLSTAGPFPVPCLSEELPPASQQATSLAPIRLFATCKNDSIQPSSRRPPNSRPQRRKKPASEAMPRPLARPTQPDHPATDTEKGVLPRPRLTASPFSRHGLSCRASSSSSPVRVARPSCEPSSLVSPAAYHHPARRAALTP